MINGVVVDLVYAFNFRFGLFAVRHQDLSVTQKLGDDLLLLLVVVHHHRRPVQVEHFRIESTDVAALADGMAVRAVGHFAVLRDLEKQETTRKFSLQKIDLFSNACMYFCLKLDLMGSVNNYYLRFIVGFWIRHSVAI